MRRAHECLVRKRDGRREWLRAAKLCRSVVLALADGDGSGVAFDVTASVLREARAVGAGGVVRARDLAVLVEMALCAHGRPDAAGRYRRSPSHGARVAAARGGMGESAPGLPPDRGCMIGRG